MYFILISVSIFFSILFLQSGLDKVINWTGNLTWLKEYFAKTPLKNMVTILLATTTLLELGAGILSGIGAVLIPMIGNIEIAQWGIYLSNISFLCLFFGQRMAKDYAGAAGMVPYFFTSLLAIYFFASYVVN